MSDLNIIDAEIVVSASEARASVDRARSHALGFWHEVKWQIENRAWEALGYESLDAFWDAEYMSLNVGIARSDRPELVWSFRKAGQKPHEIAAKLNVSTRTIESDTAKLRNEGAFDGVTITNSRGQERPATYRTPATERLRDAGAVDIATGEIYDPTRVTPENRAEIQAERDRMLNLYTDAQTFTGALNRLAGLSDPRQVETYLEIHRIAQTRPDFPTKHHNPEDLRNIAQHLLNYADALEEQP